MDYQGLDLAGKRVFAPLLLRKLGAVRGGIFTVEIGGRPQTFKCTDIKFSWVEETIHVRFLRCDSRYSLYYSLDIPFLQPIQKDFNLSHTTWRRTEERHVVEKVIKVHTKPTNLPQAIELLRDTGPYEILREDKLTKRDTEVAMRVLANVIGMLEALPKGMEDEQHKQNKI